MTEMEAKDIIQGKLDCMKKCDTFDCLNSDDCDECDYCYAQGTFVEQKEAFEIAIQTLEKQIPKKPMISYDERVKENWCSCGVCAFGFGWKRNIHYKYCPNCGQKLDWSKEE